MDGEGEEKEAKECRSNVNLKRRVASWRPLAVASSASVAPPVSLSDRLSAAKWDEA